RGGRAGGRQEDDAHHPGARRRRGPHPPMTAAAGRVLILLALLVSSAGAMAGFAAGARGSEAGWRLTRRLAYAFAALMAAANALMVWSLLRRDFSVGYVAHVGSRS